MSSCRRISRCLLVCAALLSLAGCGTTLIYERADSFAGRWLNGYVELEPQQRAALEAELEALHDWHRREHLPRYSAWLRSVAVQLEAPGALGPAEITARGEELGAFWRELADRALPPLLELGSGLEETQVTELVTRLREEHEEMMQEDAGRSAEWLAGRRARSMERFLKRWTGRLSAEQRAEVRAWSQQLEPSREAWLESRIGWIDAMERALASRHDQEALELAARTLIARPEDRWSEEYAGLVARNSARTTDFLARFLAGLDPEQRTQAVERLESLASDFASLAATDG
jgi:flagellar biosynthesis chaperone FliJ